MKWSPKLATKVYPKLTHTVGWISNHGGEELLRWRTHNCFVNDSYRSLSTLKVQQPTSSVWSIAPRSYVRIRNNFDKEIKNIRYDLMLNEHPQEFITSILKRSRSSHHSSLTTYQSTVIIPHVKSICEKLKCIGNSSIKVLTKNTYLLYGTSTINTILTIVYTGRSFSLLTSAAMIGVQMGEISRLG
jgi:hypothetical protein